MKYFFSWITILFYFLFWNTHVYSKTVYKEVEVSGLKILSIYSEEYIIKRFDLDRLRKSKKYFKGVAKKINAFYHGRGYILASIYLIEETGSRLHVYVDEGKLGKIIFRRLSSIDTLKIKYDFELKYNVYNEYRVEKELKRLKKKYGFRDVYANIKTVKRYDKSLFQFDRELEIPLFGTIRLPLSLKYGQRYDLEIYFVKKRSEGSREFTYGFRTSYTKGIIPYLKYRYPSIIADNDRLEVGSSVGIYYGFDLKFKEIPRWTFMEVNSKYHFKPTLNEHFTPHIKGSAYRSRTSRKDIGLSRYEYLKLRGALVPGITILNKLKINAGVGGERVFIYNSEEDTDAEYSVDIEKHTDYWNYFEFETKLDLIPWTLKRTIKRELKTTYIYYRNNTAFHEFFFKGLIDFEFANFDIFNFAFKYAQVWNNPPFYHEIPVSGSMFKGFMGKGYHSRKISKVSSEYRISLYRDFIFGGIFTDATSFKGSGYDLSGDQYGIVYGISGHIIFLDQFEFNIYYGKDYLYSTEESQYNIDLSMHKKW